MNEKIRNFFPKVLNQIPRYVAKFAEHLPVEKISVWGIDAISGSDVLVSRLESLLGCNLTDVVRNADANEREAILQHANFAMQHLFDVLGSGPIKMEPIHWSREIKTGYEWPVGVYYLKLRSITPKAQYKSIKSKY